MKLLKGIFFVIIITIFFRWLLFDESSLTSYNLPFELPHLSDQDTLTLYVQKQSFRGLQSVFGHGGYGREFIFHKVAKIDINLSNDKISKTTLTENQSEMSMFSYSGGPRTYDLYDQFCEDNVDKNKPIYCDIKYSKQYKNNI